MSLSRCFLGGGWQLGKPLEWHFVVSAPGSEVGAAETCIRDLIKGALSGAVGPCNGTGDL